MPADAAECVRARPEGALAVLFAPACGLKMQSWPCSDCRGSIRSCCAAAALSFSFKVVADHLYAFQVGMSAKASKRAIGFMGIGFKVRKHAREPRRK
eukprot:6184045-Pleurochrysis_carterae.AAC.2